VVSSRFVLSLAALVLCGCVTTSTRPLPTLLLNVNERVEFGAGVSIPLLVCPEMMWPVCEPFGRVGTTECYCAY
jgi:hypothetical protein